MADIKATAIQKQQTLQQLAWDEISESGAYVEISSGNLYRIHQEALLKGSSPVIHVEGASSAPFVQVSKNPFVLELQARMVCAGHNIQPNF